MKIKISKTTKNYTHWIMTDHTLQTNTNIHELYPKWHYYFNLCPWPFHVIVGSQMLSSEASVKPTNQLCIHPTVGGKTPIFSTFASCLKATTLWISPLLFIGADKIQNVIDNAMLDTIINSLYVDEVDSTITKKW